MQVLRARLPGEQHELFRADARGVHVDHHLEPGLLELGEAEVRHLDLALLGRGEDDAGLRERRGRACLCLLDLGPRQHARGEGYEGSGRVAGELEIRRGTVRKLTTFVVSLARPEVW